MEFRTERLLLRQWRESDLSPFAELNADPRVMECFPTTLSKEESDQLVGRIQDGFAQNGFGLWAVEVANSVDFIGFVGLAVPKFEAHFTPCVEIGWRIAFDQWGVGYATEAAASVAKFAFSDLGLDEIVSLTSVQNQRSRRVMEKLGMTRREEDDFDHPALPDGHELQRHVLYRLSSSEWSPLA